MAEYMDLSESRSPKFLVFTILAWIIFCIILMAGAGIRNLKESRAADKEKIEQCSPNSIKK